MESFIVGTFLCIQAYVAQNSGCKTMECKMTTFGILEGCDAIRCSYLPLITKRDGQAGGLGDLTSQLGISQVSSQQPL